jgi:hypothetical protein
MKMNLSMEFLRPLTGNLKKYTALLPSIIITVVALLLLLPTMLVGNNVKEKMNASKKTAQEVQTLSKNVPSKNDAPQLRIYMDRLEEDANRIKQIAIQSSRRDLVTYDHVIFPKPLDESTQIFTLFGGKYRSAIESLIKKMNAKDAPSDVEIRDASGAGGAPTVYGARPAVKAEDPMVDALCMTRAQEISVYANLSGFPWYAFWEKYVFSGKDQALEDCWDSQVAFWIYEDIVDTIIKMNGSTGQVSSSPVKRLMGVSFTGPVTTAGPQTAAHFGAMASGMSTRDVPNYVTATIPSHFMESSPTARISDKDVDVVHFAVSVLVDSRSVLPFMKELCSEKPHVFYPEFDPAKGQQVNAHHNQITILKTDLKVVDKTDPEHEYYRYGKGAVMRLDLICEYLFNRAGYDSIKPEPVKKRLGQFEDTQDQTTPGGTPGGIGPGGMYPM